MDVHLKMTAYSAGNLDDRHRRSMDDPKNLDDQKN